MKTAPAGLHIATVQGEPLRAVPEWYNWMVSATNALNILRASGTTAKRPVKSLFVGRTYFDTTLGKPIWYDGSGWVDATGASA